MVGMTRFERATPSSQAKCATKLRYIPTDFIKFSTITERSLVFLSFSSIKPYGFPFACPIPNVTFSHLLHREPATSRQHLLLYPRPTCYLSENVTFSHLFFGRVKLRYIAVTIILFSNTRTTMFYRQV